MRKTCDLINYLLEICSSLLHFVSEKLGSEFSTALQLAERIFSLPTSQYRFTLQKTCLNYNNVIFRVTVRGQWMHFTYNTVLALLPSSVRSLSCHVRRTWPIMIFLKKRPLLSWDDTLYFSLAQNDVKSHHHNHTQCGRRGITKRSREPSRVRHM